LKTFAPLFIEAINQQQINNKSTIMPIRANRSFQHNISYWTNEAQRTKQYLQVIQNITELIDVTSYNKPIQRALICEREKIKKNYRAYLESMRK